jgi:hypothetical protein
MSTIRKGSVVGWLLVVLVFVVTGSSRAEIPRKINYQGKLADAATGLPVAGPSNMTFRIYDDPTAGSLLWSETQTLSADSAGIFSAVLGSSAPIEIPLDSPVWLEVEVGGEVLSPRRELVSVPFALRAKVAEQALDADSLGGFESADFVRQGQASVITSEMIMDGTGSGLDADMLDGLNADAFADTGHIHDDRYYTQDSLRTPGTLNESPNPVDWTKLKSVPVGFADGIDDEGAGDGHSLDAADGSPVDAVFVDDAGNVGIGTISPGERLDVYGSIDLAEHLKIGGNTVVSIDGSSNTLLGVGAGQNNTGNRNTFLGTSAGNGNAGGYGNTYLGFETGALAVSGLYNTFVGCQAGSENDLGQYNTLVGAGAGFEATGSFNTLVGNAAGYQNQGDHNVFLGYQAGYGETGSDRLYIANGQYDYNVLIYGDFAADRVGINTTSPEEALDVNGAARITAVGSPLKLHTGAGYIELESDNPDPMGLRLSNATRDWYLINGPGFNDRLSFYDSDMGKERLVIEGPSGQVGIGVSEPTAMLTVNDNLQDVVLGIPGIAIGNSGGNAGVMLGSDQLNYGLVAWNHLHYMEIMSTGGVLFNLRYDYVKNHVIKFTNDGDIGVGTDSPEERLHLVGENPRILIEAETSNPEINFKSSGDASSDIWALYKDATNNDLYFFQNGAIRMALKNSTGSVGIGTNNVGSYKLYVQGEAYSTVNWTSSDLRFKKEIGGIKGAVDRVLGLRGVVFKWKGDEYADRGFPEGEHFGVIAQETEEVMPEIVKEGPDGEKAVAYTEIIPVLIEAIKAQQKQIESLEARIEDLER